MNGEESKAYCEGLKAGMTLIRADLDRIMNIFDEVVEEILNKKELESLNPIQFIQELKERTKRPTKEGEVRVIMADGVDFLTRAIEFAFLKGFTFATTKMEMTLNLEILKKMEKIWGEKDAPGKTWDASKFEEN